jgi:hypothetical protein
MSSRRSFLKTVGQLIAVASMPVGGVALASGTRIIVVGGGVAGTRAAAYLKMSLPSARVTLFDPAINDFNDRDYYAVQNDFKPVSRQVLEEIGIEVIADSVMQVDPAEKTVYLADQKSYRADLLVVAPGVDFKWSSIPGYRAGMERNIVHAWDHPSDELVIWKQIEAMDGGQTVVIAVPAAPYRFPVGPYQRATRIAAYLKTFKPRSKVLILDSNDSFPTMYSQLDQWADKFPHGMVEWVSASRGGAIKDIDLETRTLYLTSDKLQAGVLNLIPGQQAGMVARRAGLAFRGDWCQVLSSSLESTHYKDVYVIGDANDADLYNKSAKTAHQQALQCATHLRDVFA